MSTLPLTSFMILSHLTFLCLEFPTSKIEYHLFVPNKNAENRLNMALLKAVYILNCYRTANFNL